MKLLKTITGMEIVADFEQDLKDHIRECIRSLSGKPNMANLKKEFNLNDNTYWD